MKELWIVYLNHADAQALAMTDAEIVAAVEAAMIKRESAHWVDFVRKTGLKGE